MINRITRYDEWHTGRLPDGGETKGSGVDINGIPVSSDDVGLINTV